MIHAIFKDGQIQPLDTIPENWQDGQHLVIDVSEPSDDPADIDRWYEELQRLSLEIPDDDHVRVQAALEEQKQAGKEWMRRQSGLGL